MGNLHLKQNIFFIFGNQALKLGSESGYALRKKAGPWSASNECGSASLATNLGPDWPEEEDHGGDGGGQQGAGAQSQQGGGWRCGGGGCLCGGRMGGSGHENIFSILNYLAYFFQYFFFKLCSFQAYNTVYIAVTDMYI